jgi:hypothetical protein
MRKSVERIAAVIGATAIAVVAIDAVSVAATGNGLVLGHVNSAGKTTTINNTGSGAVLNLHTKKSTSPPLTTNATGQVQNLNASKVGGYTASQLRGHWALVNLNASVTSTSGGISATSPGAGIYCLTVAGANPSTSIATVSPDYAHDTTDTGALTWAVVEPRSKSIPPSVSCAANQFEVRTFAAAVNAAGPTATLTPHAEPFSFFTPS